MPQHEVNPFLLFNQEQEPEPEQIQQETNPFLEFNQQAEAPKVSQPENITPPSPTQIPTPQAIEGSLYDSMQNLHDARQQDMLLAFASESTGRPEVAQELINVDFQSRKAKNNLLANEFYEAINAPDSEFMQPETKSVSGVDIAGNILGGLLTGGLTGLGKATNQAVTDIAGAGDPLGLTIKGPEINMEALEAGLDDLQKREGLHNADIAYIRGNIITRVINEPLNQEAVINAGMAFDQKHGFNPLSVQFLRQSELKQMDRTKAQLQVDINKTLESQAVTIQKQGQKEIDDFDSGMQAKLNTDAQALNDQFKILVDKAVDEHNKKIEGITDQDIAAELVQTTNAQIQHLQQRYDAELKSLEGTLITGFTEQRQDIQRKFTRRYEQAQQAASQQYSKKISEMIGGLTGNMSKAQISDYQDILIEEFQKVNAENNQSVLEGFRAMPFSMKIDKVMGAGINDLLSSVGGGLAAIDLDAASATLNRVSQVQELTSPLPVIKSEGGEFLLDPDWWVLNAGRTLPMMGALMAISIPTGGAAAGLASGLITRAAARGLVSTGTGTTIASSVAGGTTAWVLETFLEAGSGYNEAVRSGKTHDQAAAAAANIAKIDMATLPLMMLELAPFYSKKFNFLKAGATQAPSNALEEIIQEYAQAKQIDPELGFLDFAFSQQGFETGVIGAALAFGMSAFTGGANGTATSADMRKAKIMEMVQAQGPLKVEAVLETALTNNLMTKPEYDVAISDLEAVQVELETGKAPEPSATQSREDKIVADLTGQKTELEEQITENMPDVARSAINKEIKEIETRIAEITGFTEKGEPVTALEEEGGGSSTQAAQSSLEERTVPADSPGIAQRLTDLKTKIQDFAKGDKVADLRSELRDIRVNSDMTQEQFDSVFNDIDQATKTDVPRETTGVDEVIKSEVKPVKAAPVTKEPAKPIEPVPKIKLPSNFRAGTERQINSLSKGGEITLDQSRDFRKDVVEAESKTKEFEQDFKKKGTDPQAVVQNTSDLNQEFEEVRSAALNLKNPTSSSFGKKIEVASAQGVIKSKDAKDLSVRYAQLLEDYTHGQNREFSKIKDKQIKEVFQSLYSTQDRATDSYLEAATAKLTEALPGITVEILGNEEFEKQFKKAGDINRVMSPQENDETIGLAVGDKIYINRDFAKVDTPIHEFAHLWLPILKQKFGGVYQEGINKIKDSEFFEQAKSRYPFLSEEQQIDEALVTAIGNAGGQQFQKEYLDNDAIDNWVNKFWNKIKSFFGIKTKVDISKTSLKDFVNIIASELLSGVNISDQGLVFHDFTNVPEYKTETKDYPGQVKEFRNQNPGFTVKLDTFRDKFITAIQDKYNSVNKLQKSVRDAGFHITDEQNTYRSIELFVGKAKDRINIFEQQVLKSLKNQEPALMERIKKAGLDLDNFGLYLYSKHAPERNKENAKLAQGKFDAEKTRLEDQITALKDIVDPSKSEKSSLTRARNRQEALEKGEIPGFELLPDGGSGMTDAQAADIIKEIEATGKSEIYESFATEFYNLITKPNLKASLESSLVSQELFDKLNKTYEFYVPLKIIKEADERLTTGGADFSVPGRNLFRAKGSKKFDFTKRENPVIQSILDFENNVVLQEKNITDNAFLSFVEAHPNPDLYEIVNFKSIPLFNSRGEPVFITDPNRFNDNTLQLWKDGKQIGVKINSKELAESIRGLGVGKSIPLLSHINTYLRAVNTLYNPEFIFTNFTRDIQAAVINISAEEISGMKRKLLKNIAPAMRGIWQAERGTEGGVWAEVVRDLRSQGGEVSWFDYSTIEDRVDGLRKRFDRYNSDKTLDKLKIAFNDLGDYIDSVNKVVETASRTAAYKAAIDSGISKPDAAVIAKNLTVNFNKKGNLGILIDSLYLFANAGIQGTAILTKNMVKSPTVRKLTGAVVATNFVIAMLNDWIDGEDDEYLKIDRGQRSRKLIFMTPSGNRITAPLPYGYNIFKVLGDVAYWVAVGKMSPSQGMSEIFLAMGDAFNPLQSATLPQLISPTVLDPFVQIAENKNWFGGPIKPEQPAFQPQQPESTLYFKSARKMSVETTKYLNELTGGTEQVKGAVDLSPEVVDHFIDFIAGGLGKFVMNSVNLGVSVSDGELPEVSKIPFAKIFYGNKSSHRDLKIIYDYVNNAYQKKYSDKEVEKFQRSIETAIKEQELSREDAAGLKKRFLKGQRVVQRSLDNPELTREELKPTRARSLKSNL